MRDSDSPLSFLFVSILFALSSLLFPRMVSPALAAQTTEDVTIDLSSYSTPTTVTISSNVGTLIVFGATDLAINIVIEGNTTNVYHTGSGANSSITIQGNLQGEAILDGPLGSFSVLGNGTGGGMIRVNQPLGSLSISGNSNLTVDLVSTVGEVNIVGNVNGGMNVGEGGDVGTIVIQGNLTSPIVIADGVTVDNLFITGNVSGGGSVVVADGGTLNNLMVVGSVSGSTDVPAQPGDMACVSNHQPLASVSVSPSEAVPGTLVTLDASASTDAEDGSPTSYTWQVTSAPEPVALAPNAGSPTVTFTPDTWGDFEFSVTLEDSCGFVDVREVLVALHPAGSVDGGPALAFVKYTAVEVGNPFSTGGAHLSMHGPLVALGGGAGNATGVFDTVSESFTDLSGVFENALDEPAIWGGVVLDRDRLYDVASGSVQSLPAGGGSDLSGDWVAYAAFLGQPDVWLFDRLTGGSLHTGQGGFATKVWGDWAVFTTNDFRLGAHRISSGATTLFPTLAYTNDAWSTNRRFVWDQNAVFMNLDEYFGGADLDGDGKLTVSVGHLSLSTMQTRKLAIGTPLGIHGSRVIFYNDLAAMWGDSADYRLKLYDLAADRLTDLGLQVGSAALFGNVIAFTAAEAWVGQDLTGDGDTADWVLGYAALRNGL